MTIGNKLMEAIEYISGDATIPRNTQDAITIICHCCNAFGGWGRGFVLPLGKRYPKAKTDYVSFCKPYQLTNEKKERTDGKGVLVQS